MSDTGPPYQSHSDTSAAAAEAIAESAATLRAEVYRFLFRCGWTGATDEEISLALKMPGNTERPRRIELFAAGLVFDSGMRRRTRSKRLAVVWVLGRFLVAPTIGELSA